MRWWPVTTCLVFALLCVAGSNCRADDRKRVVVVAGTPSHGPGRHEYNAGALLLKKCLDTVPGLETVVFTNGWPAQTNAFDGADAIVLYMDGGDRHPAIQNDHLAQLAAAMKRGAGLACLHYAVEVPAHKGGMEFLNWIGGYFEANWSVNPVWDAEFTALPPHPIANGVRPFKIRDEWYFHMRFQDGGVTPILTGIPPDSVRDHPDDPHAGNPIVRAAKGMPEDVAWAYERPDGGRGFGFTGGHFHQNWGNDDFRKIVLNAILWIAKMDVPPSGVESTVTPDDLKRNLDPKAKPATE
jgi:type 1 glutamine amidotransferase